MNRVGHRAVLCTMRASYAVLAVLLIAAAWAGVSHAQSMAGPSTEAIDIAPDRGAAGMSRWLRELQTRASLLLVTAHPDDEDGGMLTFETRGQGVRAGLLSLNRGEGGQNVMAMDFDPDITGIASQPFWLHWRDDDGRDRRHAPDFFARRADGSGLVVDVRPDDLIPAKDAGVFRVTAMACGQAGWEFCRQGRSTRWCGRTSRAIRSRP